MKTIPLLYFLLFALISVSPDNKITADSLLVTDLKNSNKTQSDRIAESNPLKVNVITNDTDVKKVYTEIYNKDGIRVFGDSIETNVEKQIPGILPDIEPPVEYKDEAKIAGMPDGIKLYVKTNTDKKGILTVSDLTGRVILREEINAKRGENEFKFNPSGSGIYVANYTSSAGVVKANLIAGFGGFNGGSVSRKVENPQVIPPSQYKIITSHKFLNNTETDVTYPNQSSVVINTVSKPHVKWNFSASEPVNLNVKLIDSSGKKVYDGKVPLSGRISDLGSLGNLNGNWKMVYSSLVTLTDSVMFNPASGSVSKNLASRPYVFVRAIDVMTRKGEYGEKKTLDQMTALPNMSIVVGDKYLGKTDSRGIASVRPDMTGKVKAFVIDSTSAFYSKWYDIDLSAGKRDTIKDFRADAVFMVENYVDNLGKKLVETFWFMGKFETKLINTGSLTWAGWQDSTLQKKGVWIDPIFKDGKHPNTLSDIYKQFDKYHIPGLVKLVETFDRKNAFTHIIYGGTSGDAETRWFYKKDKDGFYYKDSTNVYYNKTAADMDSPNIFYYVLEHELDRVFFAYNTFDATIDPRNRQYVMYKDAILRVVGYGYSPENSELEDKILQWVVNAPTFLQIHNNFLLGQKLNLPGYTGYAPTKSAEIGNSNHKKADEIGVKIENEIKTPLESSSPYTSTASADFSSFQFK